MYNTTFSLEPLEPIFFYRTTVSNGYEYAQCHTLLIMYNILFSLSLYPPVSYVQRVVSSVYIAAL